VVLLGLRLSSGNEAAAPAAERLAATVQAAAATASADPALAADRVAEAATEAAAQVATLVAAFDLAQEEETAAAAWALYELTLQTARHVAERNWAVSRGALYPQGFRR
jgi:hypothetical protein